MQGGDDRRRSQPGELLLHPFALASLALLVLNDHLLKAAAPGPVTGKLSDLAGMLFFPILLMAAVELGLAGLRRWRGPSHRVVVATVAATGLGFALVKTSAPGASAFGWGLGLAQWLLAGGAGAPASARVVVDPSDLLALPVLLVPLALGWRRAGRAGFGGRRRRAANRVSAA